MIDGAGAAEIELDHVTKRYGNSPRPAIDDLSLTIPAGKIVVLIGPSGCGKTTTMKMINRLIRADRGRHHDRRHEREWRSSRPSCAGRSAT